jgi:hypothetical protein
LFTCRSPQAIWSIPTLSCWVLQQQASRSAGACRSLLAMLISKAHIAKLWPALWERMTSPDQHYGLLRTLEN